MQVFSTFTHRKVYFQLALFFSLRSTLFCVNTRYRWNCTLNSTGHSKIERYKEIYETRRYIINMNHAHRKQVVAKTVFKVLICSRLTTRKSSLSEAILPIPTVRVFFVFDSSATSVHRCGHTVCMDMMYSNSIPLCMYNARVVPWLFSIHTLYIYIREI